MDELLVKIAKCRICEADLPHEPRPVVQLSPNCSLILVGQAPGRRVHESGVPWDDPSGVRLRKWLQISEEDFYNPNKVGILPMGFCYPGKGKSGDLPPKPICAPTWHPAVTAQIKEPRLTILIGKYAQEFYLGSGKYKTLTEKVFHFEKFLPVYFPVPHPSPRNIAWFKKNPWFELDVLPQLRNYVKQAMSG